MHGPNIGCLLFYFVFLINLLDKPKIKKKHLSLQMIIQVRYCIYWENIAFIPSSVPKLPLSMEPSRGKMMKSDNPAPDSSLGELGNTPLESGCNIM